MNIHFSVTSHEILGLSSLCFLLSFLLKSLFLRHECFGFVVLVKHSICLLNRWLPLSWNSLITRQNKSNMKLQEKQHAKKYANYVWRNMCISGSRTEILSACYFKRKESNPIGIIQWILRFSMRGGLFLPESVCSWHAKKSNMH